MSNFHPLEVVRRGGDPQLHVGENSIFLLQGLRDVRIDTYII